MGLVNHNGCIIFFSQLHNALHIGNIALHREHRIRNYKLGLVRLALLKLLFQRVKVAVTVFQLFAERQPQPLDNGSMVLFVPQYIILAACKRRHNAQIHTETGGIYHNVLFAYIFGYARLKLFMNIQSTVQERRTGASGSIFTRSFNSRFFNTRIVNKPGIAI